MLLSGNCKRGRMRLLVVEDDADLRAILSSSLRQSGFDVDVIADGQQAINALLVVDYDIAVVDLGLPSVDGVSLLRQVRRKSRSLPILVITARDALEDRVTGLDAGADDYLIKPFELKELEARIRALLRRQRADRSDEINLGSLSFTPGNPRVMLDGVAVDLSTNEFALLEILGLRSGKVVRREDIANRLARNSEPLSDTAIDICVHRLRRRLEPHGLKVSTLRGFGYILEKQDDHD